MNKGDRVWAQAEIMWVREYEDGTWFLLRFLRGHDDEVTWVPAADVCDGEGNVIVDAREVESLRNESDEKEEALERVCKLLDMARDVCAKAQSFFNSTNALNPHIVDPIEEALKHVIYQIDEELGE